MGQGIVTSLAQMLADELDVPLEAVDMVMGDTDRCPFDRGTWGSLSTRVFGPELRAAGARAKAILLDLAAAHLGAPVERLAVRDGVVPGERHPRLTKHLRQVVAEAQEDHIVLPGIGIGQCRQPGVLDRIG